jgi:biotin carboxylase
MTRPALLLFAHQARSYAAQIQQHAARLGVTLVVLSSRPRDVRDLDALADTGIARLWTVSDEYLDQKHVDAVLEQAADEGFEIVAALATFEGYRMLMATTNRRLGAFDADPAAVRKCMDKLRCRQTLVEHGLSRAVATVLDARSLPALQASGRKLFVKPRRGAGSFACFKLDDSLNFERLQALQQQMREDLAFRAIFAGQFDFIAEDCIPGDEYSLEVMVVDGASYVIGVHAKYLDDSSGTTLEVSNSLPAPRLSDASQRDAELYVGDVLAALQLREGCYHIEARHDPRSGRWDIIEVNVRMGGALINQSVGVFTGGLSMLELWVQTLCSRNTVQREGLRRRLGALRESTRRRSNALRYGTVFMSRYGERNRVLRELSTGQLSPQPDIVEAPVRVGTRLPNAERGIFLLNVLWKVPVGAIQAQLPVLASMLDERLVVRYDDEGGDPAAFMSSPVSATTKE